MSYYKCARCGYIAKQKIDMKRHLDKKTKCEIINNSDNKIFTTDEIYNMSLVKHCISSDDKNGNGLDLGLVCNTCKHRYSSTSNFNRHLRSGVCSCEPSKNVNVYQNQQNINNINIDNVNITNVYNNQYIININCDNANVSNAVTTTLRGFDEKWDVSQINNLEKLGIVLSDHKFSNTLKTILKNDANLNVCMNDDVGIVYKAEKDNYEALSKKELLKKTMDKLHCHLKEFYDDIIKEDIFNEKLEEAKNNIDLSYNRYHYKSQIFKNKADEALTYFYNEVSKKAEDVYFDKNGKRLLK